VYLNFTAKSDDAAGASELVKLANLKGGKDNISIILIRVLEEFSNSGESLTKKLKNRFFK
jgi:serine/threonine protein phosphatase PrpC